MTSAAPQAVVSRGPPCSVYTFRQLGSVRQVLLSLAHYLPRVLTDEERVAAALIQHLAKRV
jgi:hypothetical protein